MRSWEYLKVSGKQKDKASTPLLEDIQFRVTILITVSEIFDNEQRHSHNYPQRPEERRTKVSTLGRTNRSVRAALAPNFPSSRLFDFRRSITVRLRLSLFPARRLNLDDGSDANDDDGRAPIFNNNNILKDYRLHSHTIS
jgi:hypothetical protein